MNQDFLFLKEDLYKFKKDIKKTLYLVAFVQTIAIIGSIFTIAYFKLK